MELLSVAILIVIITFVLDFIHSDHSIFIITLKLHTNWTYSLI
ncbi:protein of unknown function [Listeria monocytogenes R479a]|nr:protein of unknown function [Listeria monocytogenes R479a]CUK47850.1 hypothetical protein LM500401_70285 [Listeria monocytogenes]CUL75686.1 hypothetical protein LM801457_40287 [Listeria monocytogenes]